MTGSEFDRLPEHDPLRDECDGSCPECDGDGYVDIVDDWGGVVGPAPCPKCGGGSVAKGGTA